MKIAYRLDANALKGMISPHHFFSSKLPTMPRPKQATWNDGGLCVFHNDRHAGSFRVNIETGAFCCFSCGAKGGDIIAFLMMQNELSFREALRKLASEWGLK